MFYTISWQCTTKSHNLLFNYFKIVFWNVDNNEIVIKLSTGWSWKALECFSKLPIFLSISWLCVHIK